MVYLHACLRMVNIGRLLLDPNFKKISSVGGEYLRLIVMYWEASQNLRGTQVHTSAHLCVSPHLATRMAGCYAQ